MHAWRASKRSVRWHGAPHEKNSADVYVIVGPQLVPDAEVQSADEEREDDLVADSGTQKLRISVVAGSAVLHKSGKALPKGRGGGAVHAEVSLL